VKFNWLNAGLFFVTYWVITFLLAVILQFLLEGSVHIDFENPSLYLIPLAISVIEGYKVGKK